MINLTEKELEGLIRKNPGLKATVQLGKLETENISEKGNKYWNIKVYIYDDGFVSESKTESVHGKIRMIFDSRKEYLRFLQLQEMEKKGLISHLDRQKTLVIIPAFVYREEKIRAISYKADFAYIKDGEQVIEDVKGYSQKTKSLILTHEFILKWKMLKKKYPEYLFKIFHF